MRDAIPEPVQVVESHDGVRYALPPRPIGQLRMLGLVPVAVGLGFSGLGTWLAVDGLRAILQGGWTSIFSIIPAAIGFVFAFVGLIPLRLGAFMLGGRCDVELRNDHVRKVERAGIVRKSTRVPLGKIQRFKIVTAGGEELTSQMVLGQAGNLAALSAEYDQGESRTIVIGYPIAWLKPLAEDLSRRIGLNTPAPLIGEESALNSSGAPAVVIERGSLLKAAEEKSKTWSPREIDQPPGSKVLMERDGDHLTLTIPRVGVLKAGRGLFIGSCVWCGFMVAFTTISVFVPITGGGFSGGVIPFLLFSILFWAFGIGMMVAAINMGRRHAILDVLDGTLLINMKGLFGIKQHQWDSHEIDSIVVGPSGMEVNEVPVMELQIHPKGGRKVGLFAGRDEAELKWMAWLLHDGLRLAQRESTKAERAAA